MKKDFKFISIKNLTKDVFELEFETFEDLQSKPGQFITFLLPKTKFARAYSILKQIGNKFYFIIKKLQNGRGGSLEICELSKNQIISGIGPVGHFLLSDNQKSKLFIGTGTGLVPLFYQISFLNQNNFTNKFKLLFGVREIKDLFYLDEIKEIKNTNFSYEIFLSQEQSKDFNFGRISNFISKDTICDFEEFYICGNPQMIDEIKEKLLQLNILKQNIFIEKY